MNLSRPWPRLRFYAGNVRRLVAWPRRQRRISPSEATTIFGCSPGPQGWHYLRRTLEEYDGDPDIDVRQTTLYRYLTGFQPRSICDLIGSPSGCRLPLFVYPWGTFGKDRREWLKSPRESRFCGPSTDEFVAREFERVIALYARLKTQGYRPWSYGHGFIEGVFLYRRNGERRFVVLQGNHRLAILAHLGVRSVQVRTSRGHLTAVRERDLELWPMVREGYCDRASAQRIFDLYFKEDGAHVASRLEGVSA